MTINNEWFFFSPDQSFHLNLKLYVVSKFLFRFHNCIQVYELFSCSVCIVNESLSYQLRWKMRISSLSGISSKRTIIGK